MSKADDELQTFVREALAQGLSRQRIEAALGDAGWARDQASGALRAFADVDFPVPVPRPKPYLSAREMFLYLLLFTSLILSTFSLGSALFELIDKAFPDPVAGRYSASSLRWSLSFIIVTFPVFLILSFRQERELQADPAKRSSLVRKWLTYLTLLIASGFVLGDLVTLMQYFLEGELSLRFLLKVLVIGVLAGTAFTYYLRDLRRVRAMSGQPRGGTRLIGAMIAAMLLVLGLGLWVLDSPAKERQRKLDTKRVGSLRNLSLSIDHFWSDKDTLPKDLEELTAWEGRAEPRSDPDSGEIYFYEATGEAGYRLCATFALESSSPLPRRGYYSNGGPSVWHHSAGRQCFDLEALD